jgi:glycosyltransferase involved in cell wall biosynthesis
MTRLIDISFTAHPEWTKPHQLIVAYRPGKGYVDHLRSRLTVTVIGYIAQPAMELRDHVLYVFFKGTKTRWPIPLRAFLFVRRARPDVVLVQGLVFPLHLILLRWFVKKGCVILAQDHGNLPFTGWRKVLQQIADRSVHAYLFTAMGSADPWKAAKIIGPEKPCFEVLEGATDLERGDKLMSKATLGLQGKPLYLWVGRLEANKDPVTVVRGFAAFHLIYPEAALYMIYQTAELLEPLQDLITAHPGLADAVHLIGQVEHAELSVWFSAADYFVSGSHKEAAGYALIESMTCGCIPVVTDIPPFRKITAGHGALYEPGNPDSCCQALIRSGLLPMEETSETIARYAARELTFTAIADRLHDIITRVS